MEMQIQDAKRIKIDAFFNLCAKRTHEQDEMYAKLGNAYERPEMLGSGLAKGKGKAETKRR